MGLRTGITLVTGGGFHGKSTLLKAVERGIYNHIPGDGREHVVAVPDAVKVRSEEGRSICSVDLRPLIGDLPSGGDPATFSTQDASGSTSQAASIVENLEAGATTVLIDEDTSASNLLVRDSRMARLVPDENEPIKPLLHFVRSLSDIGISFLMAVGGSGAYLGRVDCVLRLTGYVVDEVTEEARQIAVDLPASIEESRETRWEYAAAARKPTAWDVRSRSGRLRATKRGKELRIGDDSIDVTGLEQLCVGGQMEGLGNALLLVQGGIDGETSLRDLIREVMTRVEQDGLDALTDYPSGRTVWVRELEIIGAVNRARRLAVS